MSYSERVSYILSKCFIVLCIFSGNLPWAKKQIKHKNTKDYIFSQINIGIPNETYSFKSR